MFRSVARIVLFAALIACAAALSYAGMRRIVSTRANPVAWVMSSMSGPAATPTDSGAQSGPSMVMSPADPSQTTSVAAPSAAQDNDGDADGSASSAEGPQDTDQADAQSSDPAQEHEMYGVVASVDAASSTFVLTTATGPVTVAVTNTTEYGDGLSALASLRQGMHITVDAQPPANGQALASSVKGPSDAGAPDSADPSGPSDPASTH